MELMMRRFTFINNGAGMDGALSYDSGEHAEAQSLEGATNEG
jgi:hypothetical protein